jgi:hypothetical protein
VPETDFHTTPHFSRGGPAQTAIGGATLLLDLVLPVAVFVLVLLVMRTLPARVRMHIHPAYWFALAGLCAGAVLWNRSLHALRTIRRNNDVSSLPFSPDESHRVRVICWPDEVAALRAVTADPFEPERFRAVLPDARLLDITRPGRFAAAGSAPWLVMQLLFIHPALFAVAAAVGTAVALYLLRLPTYCRFSPRRLEIIRYAPLSTRPVHRQVFDLSGPVTISTRGLGHITFTDEAEHKRRVPVGLMFGRSQAARAALAAALSHAQTPDPDSL